MKLRPVRDSDARLMFDWVNSPESLAGKLETRDPIPWETHAKWFAARLADPDTRLWMAESDNRAVGQVRVQRTRTGLEIDVFVAAECRRRGLGRRMLAAAAAECAAHWPGLPLVAKVKLDNVASQRLFAAAGYALGQRKEDHLVYILDPKTRFVGSDAAIHED